MSSIAHCLRLQDKRLAWQTFVDNVEPMEQIYRELGRRVAGARQRADLTQERLAARVGLSRTSIVNLEAGRQRVPIHQLYRIAHALGRQPADLLPPSPDLEGEDRVGQWVSKVTSQVARSV